MPYFTVMACKTTAKAWVIQCFSPKSWFRRVYTLLTKMLSPTPILNLNAGLRWLQMLQQDFYWRLHEWSTSTVALPVYSLQWEMISFHPEFPLTSFYWIKIWEAWWVQNQMQPESRFASSTAWYKATLSVHLRQNGALPHNYVYEQCCHEWVNVTTIIMKTDADIYMYLK